jgi:hypothetical protein
VEQTTALKSDIDVRTGKPLTQAQKVARAKFLASGFKKGEKKPGQGGHHPKKPLTLVLMSYMDVPCPLDAEDSVAEKRKQKTWGQMVAEGLMKSAINGDAGAFRELADRVEGKVLVPHAFKNSGIENLNKLERALLEFSNKQKIDAIEVHALPEPEESLPED